MQCVALEKVSSALAFLKAETFFERIYLSCRSSPMLKPTVARQTRRITQTRESRCYFLLQNERNEFDKLKLINFTKAKTNFFFRLRSNSRSASSSRPIRINRDCLKGIPVARDRVVKR